MEKVKKKLLLVSLGCSKNLVDSEVMLNKLKEYELTNDETIADLIILNSCAYIDSAKKESLNTLFNLNDNRKADSTLVMAGCLSQRYKDELQKELKEVDIFTGVSDFNSIDKIVKNSKSTFSNGTFLIDSEQRAISNSSFHTYIKISEGCNHSCSFCAIPSFKGKFKSRSIESIIKEIKLLVKNGYKDFTFISNDSAYFLEDLGFKNGLELLIDEVEKISEVKSARFLSLQPQTLTLAFVDRIISSKVFENYFDIPIQHISSNILEIMNTNTDSKKLKELLLYINNTPNSFLRTNIIAGHPGESQEEFLELCDFLNEFHFDRVNIFPYSDEDGTISSKSINKVDISSIEERAETLRNIALKLTLSSLQNCIGKTFEIFITSISDEHEYLLSARKTIWEDSIDGEIYINDNEYEEKIIFGDKYLVEATDLAGDKLLARIIKKL